jgi:hypothetical protein
MQGLPDAFADADLARQLFANFAVHRFDGSFGEIDSAARQVDVIASARACNQAIGVDHNCVSALARFA